MRGNLHNSRFYMHTYTYVARGCCELEVEVLSSGKIIGGRGQGKEEDVYGEKGEDKGKGRG